MKEKLYFGVATEKITPEVGARLYGYMNGIESVGVNDDLTVTALYFSQGDTKALIISATVCSFNTALSLNIRKMIEKEWGIPKDNIIMSATHTHTGPNLTGNYGWGNLDTAYCDGIFLPGLLRVVKSAVENPSPVEMAVTYGESFVGVNRRELTPENTIALGQSPWSPFNPIMTVITFRSIESGKILANIIHYGAHGTSAGRDAIISRDWPGVMVDVLGEESGADTVFLNGTEGDVGPRLANGKTMGNGVQAAMKLGALAAQDAVRIYRQTKEFHDATLSASSMMLNLPLAPRVDLETAKEQYEKLKQYNYGSNGQMANYYRMTIESYKNDNFVEEKSRTIEQTVIKIGDVAFVGLPYEVFTEIGMRIARESKIPHVLTVSCVNGFEGYFVTEDQICRGGYEIRMFKTAELQGYADNADWHLVTQTLEHLKKHE